MISIRDAYNPAINLTINEPITGYEAKYQWFVHLFDGWVGQSVWVNWCIDEHWISAADRSEPLNDSDMIETGSYIVHYRCRGGGQTTKYPTILGYFIVLTLFFIVLLTTGYLPIFCKIYSYILNYVRCMFVELPYIRLILEPFQNVQNSNVPSILKWPIYIVQFIVTSLVTIVQLCVMFLFLYGFFTIGLLIALFWIHRLPIHQAVKRARSVANILTLLYLMFYTIVLFPQFVRGFLLWGGDMMHDSSIGLILKMVANLFNFTLIPLFTWISSIHTRYTTSRIDALESGMPSQYGDLVPMLLKVDMVDMTSMVSVPELFDMGAWRSMETIPIKAIVLSVTDAIVSGRFVLPAEISGALVLAFMANYMDDVPGKLEELRTAMGIAELPGKSMRYIATVIMKIVRLGVNMTQLYKEIAPDETAFQMKIGGTVAGYMTGLGFVIAFIILAITG